jgi:hypothetical protein
MNDRDAIAQAQGLYRATCERLKKRPRETVGEIANVSGARVAVLFDSAGKLAGAYRVYEPLSVSLMPEVSKFGGPPATASRIRRRTAASHLTRRNLHKKARKDARGKPRNSPRRISR